MDFEIEDRFFNIGLPAFEAMYFDEAFNVAMCKDNGLGRKLIERTVVDGHLHRVLTIRPAREVPGVIAKLIGQDSIAYDEIIDYSFGRYQGLWRTRPNIMPDKVQSNGTLSFVQNGKDVVRTVKGVVAVKVFGVGSIIERFIVADVQKSYVQATDFMRQYQTDAVLRAP